MNGPVNGMDKRESVKSTYGLTTDIRHTRHSHVSFAHSAPLCRSHDVNKTFVWLQSTFYGRNMYKFMLY